jgi:nucleoside-diphosphate-sugar epimerase
MERNIHKRIVSPEDVILVTGATGFIGSRVVRHLIELGFMNIRCFMRPACSTAKRKLLSDWRHSGAQIDVCEGNLLSREDCRRAVRDASVIFHLAAGRGEKSYPDAILNSVVTTRNLLDAAIAEGKLRRFVNISSFSVYSNIHKPRRNVLDETCPIEHHPLDRGDAYTFAKIKQDELTLEYGSRFNLPYVIVRPGHVYGPGNEAISARVGISPTGRFLHLGGSNTIPLTYVDNCAEAIVLAGLSHGVDREVFNVTDDELPSSRDFLKLYKANVDRFRSLYFPRFISYTLCWMWEGFSNWSNGQVPPVFNRKRWHAFWKNTQYSNRKLKQELGWRPRISTAEGLNRYFESCRERAAHA